MKKAAAWILMGAVVLFLVVNVVDFATDGGRAKARLDADAEVAADCSANAVGEADANRNETAEMPDADETADEDDDDAGAADDEPLTEEEKREAEEEKLVEAFDDLTDKWQEPSASGVTLADIDNFAKTFRKIPKARHDECVHRALNLIPDENVMLLAGILMDKSMDKEILETVYNDVLNRDEDVKKPILQEVFKDKDHPCWADTAWILDVTGELPKAK